MLLSNKEAKSCSARTHPTMKSHVNREGYDDFWCSLQQNQSDNSTVTILYYYKARQKTCRRHVAVSQQCHFTSYIHAKKIKLCKFLFQGTFLCKGTWDSASIRASINVAYTQLHFTTNVNQCHESLQNFTAKMCRYKGRYLRLMWTQKQALM